MMNLGKIVLSLAILLSISCTQNLLLKKNNWNREPKLILFATDGKQIRYAHLKPKSESFQVEPGQVIGNGEPYPNPLSNKWQKQIHESNQLYSLGQFNEAANAISAAFHDEPENPFVLECYGRSLYRIDSLRFQSYKIYDKLIRIIDSKFDNDTAIVNLDLWFQEVYWKSGTLYLDSKEWDKAAYNISRALILWYNRFPNGFYEQALMFLTEAYFEQSKYDESQYYACQTLNNFPNNQYVQKYLSEMKRECKK